ncbi:GGDEF domain-containing protein [Actinoplanes sp. KI2]|uniref:GGDEF domain-containing protein n=1 Tax=Actinoplanes sp. KI2 TaxID=2983315 RepID=UPI0021D5E3BB|nr:GGDEF domain-containing protein [Actinoplanes sp. KI2]MCU7727299.1 GGDEF domain-containing protein [Actinoplanes sp. KI2]
MSDITRQVARLLERAQTGHAREALAEAERVLRGGDHAGMHYVRAIALVNLGENPIPALDLMARVAECEGSPGWHACALATRASIELRTGDTDDPDGVLHDLVTAEIGAVEETEPIAAVNARVGVAIGYFELRLYELVGPLYDAAYEMSPPGSGNRAMWLCNQAELHLFWALELYQIGEGAAAEAHTAEAERYALRAVEEADGPDAAAWRDHAMLAAACARADRDHLTGRLADEISDSLAALTARGVSPSSLAYSRPFHAVALRRSGRPDEALDVIERAVATLTPDAGWLIESVTHRTRAVLLAARGSSDAEVGLAYGDTLAREMWRQRRRTLQTVAAMKSLELLRVQHDQAALAATLDALTGVANRGAFDLAVQQAQQHPADLITVLLVDTDKFKQINDTAGHAAGDAALRAIATALSAQLRDADLLARVGGDEFAALLPGVDAAGAIGIAQRMAEAVRRLPDCPATVSIGVAVGYAGDLPEAMRRADQAMYRVKRRGGDGVEECSARRGGDGVEECSARRGGDGVEECSARRGGDGVEEGSGRVRAA